MAQITVIDIKAAMELMREGVLTTPSKVLADVMAEVAKGRCHNFRQKRNSPDYEIVDINCGNCIVCVAREVVGSGFRYADYCGSCTGFLPCHCHKPEPRCGECTQTKELCFCKETRAKEEG